MTTRREGIPKVAPHGPARATILHAEPELANSRAPSSGRVILIVDADIRSRRVLGASLREQHHDVTEARTGLEGLFELESRRPHLVLLSWELHDMNGPEMTRSVREHTDVPILAISSGRDEKSQVRALDAGASDYITKPVRVASFLARVRAFLRSTEPVEAAEFVVGCRPSIPPKTALGYETPRSPSLRPSFAC